MGRSSLCLEDPSAAFLDPACAQDQRRLELSNMQLIRSMRDCLDMHKWLYFNSLYLVSIIDLHLLGSKCTYCYPNTSGLQLSFLLPCHSKLEPPFATSLSLNTRKLNLPLDHQLRSTFLLTAEKEHCIPVPRLATTCPLRRAAVLGGGCCLLSVGQTLKGELVDQAPSSAC